MKYTWLYSKAAGSTSNAGGIFPAIDLFPLDIVSALGEVQQAKASWSLRYQLLHLELGREYRYTSDLKFKTTIGLSTTYQKQQDTATYLMPPFSLSFDGGSTTISSNQSIDFKTIDKQRIFGIGPRFAFYPTWNLVDWFGFYGNAGISYLWVYYRLTRKDSGMTSLAFEGISSIDADIKFANIKARPRAMRLFFDASLGFFFVTPERINHQFRFHFFVGWEGHLWLNQVMRIQLCEPLSRYDLTMHGLITKLRFDF